MYRLVSATGETKQNPGNWGALDIGNSTFATIYADNLATVAILEIVELKTQVQLDFADLPSTMRVLQQTVNDWLDQVGNNTIPYTTDIVTKKKTSVTFVNPWTHGFSMFGYNRNYSDEAVLGQSQITDLRLTKSGIDYANLDRHSLISINGFFHWSSYSTKGIEVPEAGKSLAIANDNRIGLLNFNGVGNITKVKITEECIVPTAGNLPYKEAVFLKIPDLNLQNRTVAMVIGGYLHILDDVYTQVGTNLIQLNLARYPFVTRYHEMQAAFDVSAIKLTEYANRPDKVMLSELMSDENILALLTLPQTFMVVIDSQAVQVRKQAAVNAYLAGRYYSKEKPTLPMFTTTGYLAEYSYYQGKFDTYVLRTSDYIKGNYLRYTYQYLDATYSTQHQITTKPTTYHMNYFLDIYRYLDEPA